MSAATGNLEKPALTTKSKQKSKTRYVGSRRDPTYLVISWI